MNNNKTKDTGANKVIILAVVNNIKESDFNCRVLIEIASVNNILEYVVTGYLKIYNILVAISNCF